MGPEQAQFLVEQGVAPDKIQIGHMCSTRSLEEHEKLLAIGAYDSFDTCGEEDNGGTPFDYQRAEMIAALIQKGYGDQILMSHDYVALEAGRDISEEKKKNKMYAAMGFDRIDKTIIPRLRELGVTKEQIRRISVDNPRSLFG